MQLSKKTIVFSSFLIAFLKSTFNFENLEKKYEPHSAYFSEIIVREGLRYLNV